MRYAATLMLVVLGATSPAAQTPAPEFDVASVKPAIPDRPFGEVVRTMRPQPGKWQSFSLTLHNIIVNAYPGFLFPGLVAGEPEWVKETRFDVDARMSPTATQAEVAAMVRRLLEQRFGLRVHTEQRTLPVYALTLVKPGTLGPGLTPASPTCVMWRMTGGRIPPECDLYRRAGGSGGLTIPVATINDVMVSMSLSAVGPPSRRVPSPIDRPIVDRTGLDGFFQIIGPSPLVPAGAEPAGSFFTLLEEQLGLKLTPARDMVDVLVIDSVRMPDPD